MDTPCYWDFELEPPLWHFVGECGLDQNGDRPTESIDEYVVWLRMGSLFLRHTFGEPPSNWVLDILWANAPHGGGKFPLIAIGFRNEADSAAAEKYASMLYEDLRVFNAAVDWRAIASSPWRTEAKQS